MDQLGRAETFQAGQSLGKFYLVRLIGEGGTSRIFKALQHPINRIVALKIPSFTEAGSILSPDEFLAEATLMARLDHPNVVRIHDFGVHEDTAFICMEYVEGWNLAELIEARGALPTAAVLAAGCLTLDALSHAHSRDVLHLDLSPANVLIGRQGSPKLSDFGMAGKLARSAEGRIIGTPAFLSPEHVAGKSGTRGSDLFSFGSLLFYAARGQPLFDPGPGNLRVTQAIREIESARSRPPEDRLRGLAGPLARIVRMCLQGAPAAEIAAELRAAYRAACGDASPEETLRRELALDGDPLGESPAEPVPEGSAMRDRYLRLRDEGRHREAMDLLERAMRLRPDDPLLRELLSQPPARQKSGAAATMAVGAGAGGPAGARRPHRLAWGAVGALALIASFLAWARSGRAPSGTPPAPAEIANAGVQGTESSPSAPAPADTANAGMHRPEASPAASAPAPDAEPAPAPQPAAIAAAPAAMAQEAALKTAPGDPEAGPRIRKAIAERRPRPPAVTLFGPAGTRVSVDDSAEWVSPAPRGGWPVAPGLLNITLTPPGSRRPISSSLFVSEDTLYVLSLDDAGGFSVSRRRR